MNYIGIDPGFANTGVVVASTGTTCTVYVGDQEHRHESVYFESARVIRTKKEAGSASEDNVRRATEIYHALSTICRVSEGDVMYVEAMSFPRNASTAAKMAMCWGVIASVSQEESIPVHQLGPKTIRNLVARKKKATEAETHRVLLEEYPELARLIASFNQADRCHVLDAAAAIVAQVAR